MRGMSHQGVEFFFFFFKKENDSTVHGNVYLPVLFSKINKYEESPCERHTETRDIRFREVTHSRPVWKNTFISGKEREEGKDHQDSLKDQEFKMQGESGKAVL